MEDTDIKDFPLNCDFQPARAFCVLRGIPHQSIDRFTEYFEYYSEKCVDRLKKMTEKYNEMLAGYGLTVDFEKEVKSLATSADGGVITEEHLLLAVANKILEKYDKGNDIIDFFLGELELEITEEQKKFLKDKFNPGYELDIVDVLKTDISGMWIDAHEECPSIKEFVKIAKETGAILTYPCSGAENISEDFLSQLKKLGFNAISYIPSNLTNIQIETLKQACDKLEMLRLNGNYINRPRQSFASQEPRDSESEYLKETSWAVIGHEKAASVNEEFGMFSRKIMEKFPTLDERVNYFSYLAKKCQNA